MRELNWFSVENKVQFPYFSRYLDMSKLHSAAAKRKEDEIVLNKDPAHCSHCGKNMLEYQMKIHLSHWGTHHTKKCTQCDIWLETYDENVKHVEEVHGGKWKYICGKCPDLFDEEKQRAAHRQLKHDSKSKICKICKEPVTHMKRYVPSTFCFQNKKNHPHTIFLL